MEDDTHIHTPLHTQNVTSRQFLIERCSLANQRESMTFFNQHLHLDRVRSARIVRDLYACLAKEFQEPRVSDRISLRMIKNGKLVVQFRHVYRSSLGERMICPQTNHELVSAEALNA
jgi:hypothetical protein